MIDYLFKTITLLLLHSVLVYSQIPFSRTSHFITLSYTLDPYRIHFNISGCIFNNSPTLLKIAHLLPLIVKNYFLFFFSGYIRQIIVF